MNKLDKINELEEQLALLKDEIIAEQQSANVPAQWEPEGGDWYVDRDNLVYHSLTEDKTRLAGVERPTKELANKAAEEIQVYKRLLAYRDQFDPDYVENWDGNNEHHYVEYSYKYDNYYTDYSCTFKRIGAVYMSEEVAEELVRKLNSGEVVL